MRLAHPRGLGTYGFANSVVLFVCSKAYQILSDPVSNPFVSHPHLYHPRHTFRPVFPYVVGIFCSSVSFSFPFTTEFARGI